MAITKAGSGDHNIAVADTEEALWTSGTITGDGVYWLEVKLTDLGAAATVIVKLKVKTTVATDVSEIVWCGTAKGAQSCLTMASEPIILDSTDEIDGTIEASDAGDNFIWVLYKMDHS